MKKFLIVSFGLIAVIALASPWIIILVGRNQLHNYRIPQREQLVENEPKQRVLAIFPHPDDEVTVAGTIQTLKEDGHEVRLACLTRGEKGKSSGIKDEVELAKIRSKEMAQAADILGLDELVLMDLPDSGLEKIGVDSIKKVALNLIDELQPDILLSYDSKVGLYGHSDHRIVGQAVEEVFLEQKGKPGFSPTRLFQVTLCQKQIDVAMKLSAGFQRNYPEDPALGLPTPDFSIRTQPHFAKVKEVMKAHQSQQKVLKDMMPFHDRVPTWIYSRVFDREYFVEVK